MIPRIQTFVFFVFYIVLTILCPKQGIAADVILTQPMSFGNIIVAPGGDGVDINAKYGPAKPVSLSRMGSHLDGSGYSGLIRVLSDRAGQTITLVYPVSILLKGMDSPLDTMLLDTILLKSKNYAISTKAGEEIDFDIGGRLHIKSDQHGQAYTGTMPVTVNIFNP